ncbi:DUF4145 domain-containing protein [Methylobacterium fujisawaense]|uniref:DUF4145 domain-containing protein n=1 Tax=Methylobacterium fujisawaense TaxID=107400 RepID=UPI00313E541A
MAVFVHTCPFCSGKLGLDVVAVRPTGMHMPALYLHCSACHMPSLAIVAVNSPGFETAARDPQPRALNAYIGGVVASHPGEQPERAPDHVPPEVGRVFLQSRGSHRRGDMDLAAMGYRRSVELALKAADPSIKGQLGPRTDALAARKVLNGSMKDWADNVRLLGNDANHDPPEPTPDAVEDLHLFTETLLEFLFTMPERVKRRREATEEGKAGIGNDGPKPEASNA